MNANEIKVKDIVRLTNPANALEKAARYLVIEVNEDRVQIGLICDMAFVPVETVRLSDIRLAD